MKIHFPFSILHFQLFYVLPRSAIDYILKTVLFQNAFACPLRLPLLQKTTMLFLFLNLDNWLGTLSNGMFTAPFTLPAENSAGVRTSTKNAPFFIASLNSLLSVGANRFLKIPNIFI